jgi:NADH-quinone oxidoreductase subunit M
VLSVWEWSRWAAVAAAIVVVLTAGYILWTIQRVYLGAEYRGPHEEELHPLNVREFAIAATLFVAAIVLGVFPWHTTLRYMDATIDRQVTELEAWKQRNLALIEGESEDAAATAKSVGDESLMAASR